MSEGKNPFADDVTRRNQMGPSRRVWIVAGVLAAMIAAIGIWIVFHQQQLDRQELRAALEEANATLRTAKAENAKGLEKIAELQARIAGLEKEKEAAVQTHKSLEDEMRAALESKDVTISQLQGKLTVSILDRILFDSGEADLKSEGAAVLRKIAALLAQHPELKIHVLGHTDNVPIRPAARTRFPSNWELSTTRATAAVRFLTENAGVDPRRVGALGYGEFRPVADNATPEGRARNRRIAITILPDELAGADTAPTARTNAPANIPPPEPSPENSAPIAK